MAFWAFLTPPGQPSFQGQVRQEALHRQVQFARPEEQGCDEKAGPVPAHRLQQGHGHVARRRYCSDLNIRA